MQPYPLDEFDNAASERGPVGVHRKRKSVAGAIIAPFVVFILAGALAYGVVAYLWGVDAGSRDQATPTITRTSIVGPTDDLSTVSPSPSESASPSPTPTATAEPVHFDASIVVLNAAKISGLAGKNAEKVTAGGFTAVTAGNASSNLPSANTVRYSEPKFATTAQQVASLLGIAVVEQGDTPEGNISVYLITDPAK